MKTFYFILAGLLILMAISNLILSYYLAKVATQETSALLLSCFLALLARISQAAAHNSK